MSPHGPLPRNHNAACPLLAQNTQPPRSSVAPPQSAAARQRTARAVSTNAPRENDQALLLHRPKGQHKFHVIALIDFCQCMRGPSSLPAHCICHLQHPLDWLLPPPPAHAAANTSAGLCASPSWSSAEGNLHPPPNHLLAPRFSLRSALFFAFFCLWKLCKPKPLGPRPYPPTLLLALCACKRTRTKACAATAPQGDSDSTHTT